MDGDDMVWFGFILIILGCCAAYQYYEYTLILKYFPDMSFWDYCFLGDKVRITP